MNYIDEIKQSLRKGDDPKDIARKVYLLYPSKAFVDRENIEYEIKNSIKNELNIPFTSIQIVGSAKTGFSVYNLTSFTEKKSDLDISIINSELYSELVEIAHKETDGYSNKSKFKYYKGQSTYRQYSRGLEKGYFNPFYMPDCDRKEKWMDYFRELSNSYYKIFKDINAAVYSSEYFFEYKQSDCIEKIKGSEQSYDDSLPSKV